MPLDKIIGAVMFADIKGYSKLTEYQLRAFGETVLPRIADVVHKVNAVHVNTWGDAIVCATRTTAVAARLALQLRDLFANTNWEENHLPNTLALRCSLHVGVMFVGDDPILKRPGVLGTQVTRGARIEPITEPGQVFATEEFKALFAHENDDKVAFDSVGEYDLPKGAGTINLFRIRWSAEAARPAPPAKASGEVGA